MAEPDLLILPCDLKTVRKGQGQGYCRPGLERWASAHGFSLKVFMREGILLSKLEGINDPFLPKIVEEARKRVAREGATQ